MPSVGTSVLSARVKDRTLATLNEVASENGMTVPMLLNLFAEYLNMGEIRVVDRETMAFNGGDDEYDLTELERVAERARKSPQSMLDYLIAAFENRY